MRPAGRSSSSAAHPPCSAELSASAGVIQLGGADNSGHEGRPSPPGRRSTAPAPGGLPKRWRARPGVGSRRMSASHISCKRCQAKVFCKNTRFWPNVVQRIARTCPVPPRGESPPAAIGRDERGRIGYGQALRVQCCRQLPDTCPNSAPNRAVTLPRLVDRPSCQQPQARYGSTPLTTQPERRAARLSSSAARKSSVVR